MISGSQHCERGNEARAGACGYGTALEQLYGFAGAMPAFALLPCGSILMLDPHSGNKPSLQPVPCRWTEDSALGPTSVDVHNVRLPSHARLVCCEYNSISAAGKVF